MIIGILLFPFTLNMANTVGPIIETIAQKACGYENIQTVKPAKGGQLIYKREKCENCVGGMGNVYYIRCFDWQWEGDSLWRRPTKDVPVGTYSCIPEKEVEIPYADERLQRARIGEKIWTRPK